MKLEVVNNPNAHEEMVTAITWTPDNELYSFSDDKKINRWNMDAEVIGEASEVDAFITSVSWFPSIGRQSSDTFAASCSDGTVRLMSKGCREDKKVEAHHGAVIQVAWNYDGSALLSGGEDGTVKIWSRSGNLRSTLAQTGKPIYAMAWGPDNDQVIFVNGKTLSIKSVQVGKKQVQWNAHDGVVLCLDWNIVNNLIISGGEDCMYKVWDAYGRQLYQSSPYEHFITSLAWSPNGETFAVGAYNMVRLCDRTGWSHCRSWPTSGSLMKIAWTTDGTQLAGAGGSGSVLFAHIVDRQLEWNNYEVTLTEPKQIRVRDAGQETEEVLDFPRDRVVEMALGCGHLVVTTASQCFIYAVQNLNTPYIFDIRSVVKMIKLCEKCFLTVDGTNGVQVYSYEGRLMSNPKFQGLRPEFLNKYTVALSPDTVAIIDSVDTKVVRFFDHATGRPLQTVVRHDAEVVEICLSQYGASSLERRLCFIDRNRELYISPITQLPGYTAHVGKGPGGRPGGGGKAAAAATGGGTPVARHKLHTHVDTVSWAVTSDMLAGIADGRLLTWCYPNAAYSDRDLLPKTCISRDAPELGKIPTIIGFHHTAISVRRADGTVMDVAAPSHVPMLYDFVGGKRWEEAVRLCRFVKVKELWGCLAAMAIEGKHLDTAEIALAAVVEVDKLQFVSYIKDIPTEEGKQAMIALYRRCPDEAERILLQATPPLTYRAIKLNIRLYRWSRALDLAVKAKSHVDTVLGYRERFLRQFNKKETDPRFLQYADQVQIDWEAINAKKEQEREDERNRAGGGGGGGGAGYK